MAALIALLLAVPLAFVAALNRHEAPDTIIRGVFQVGLSMPVFYVGLVLLTVFAARLRWFPVGGYGDSFLDNLYHLFLPAMTLALSLAAVLMRNLRAAIIEVLGAEYVDFARAKGLRSRVILVRHVLRNALISTVTLFGLSIGTLLGGAVITETVFAIPGVGRLMIDSIYGRDYPVIQGLTLALALLVSLIFLVTDIVQAWLDPRVGAMTRVASPAAVPAHPHRALPAHCSAPCVVLGASLILAFFPSLFAPYDPIAFDYQRDHAGAERARIPSAPTISGATCSRASSHAYRIDMQIAVFATTGPFLFGTIVGALVGYYGGWPEALFGRVVDAVITFPFLVLVIAIVSVLGPGLGNMYIAVGVVGWVFYARLVAAEVKVQRRLDYADAARVMGYGHTRIIFRHLLPNAITPAVVYWMTDMALAILLGSSLGYLGLGAQPPAAEWGVLIADGKNFMTTAWWISVFPGIAIVLTGLGFSLAGDGLAEMLRANR